MTIVQQVNRRRFLTATGVTAAAALAAGATQVDWGRLLSAAQENPLDPDAGVLADLVVRDAVSALAPEPLYLRRPDVRVPGAPKRVS